MNLTVAQIEAAWVAAGGNAKAAPMAASIALAESGGDPNNTGHNTNGTTDRGLWQINSIHGAQSTYDLAANARAAVAISNNGTNWQPWSTYNNKRYQQFTSKVGMILLPGPKVAAPVDSSSLASTAPGQATGVFTTAQHSEALYALVFVGLVALGGFLAFYGVNRATGGAPGRAAKTAAKVGTAAAL